MLSAAQRLGLGTVQWGMSYGIANQSGVAPAADVSAILKRARESGVTTLDTAWAYGDAERALGEHRAVAAGFKVVTKTRPLKGTDKTPAESADLVEEAFRASLSTLGGTAVYGLLVHHADDLLGPAGNALWKRLQELRAEGMVEKIGCSLYRPAEFAELLARYQLDLVQVPYNIYDQRYVTSGLSCVAKSRGVEVHLRSAFLQGVLLMPPERLPEHFRALRAHHARLWTAYQELGVPPLQAALGFSLHCADADRIIVGCEQVRQWEEILATADSPLPPGAMERLRQFAVDDEVYVNPARWKK